MLCPLLTIFVFYYCTVVSVDPNPISAYYISTINCSLCFLICVLFNEVWIISFSVFAPFQVVFIWY